MTSHHPILAALMGAALLLSGPAHAADVAYPIGARAGIAPPPGVAVSEAFRGYQDKDRNIIVFVVELPATAFAEIEKGLTLEALSPKGFVGEKREAFDIENGKGVLFTGKQTLGNIRLKQWILAASIGDLTALVNVQMREGAAQTYPEAAIRTALATLKVRPNPLAEQIAHLPFKFGELSGFRVFRVVGNVAAALTDGPKDGIDDGAQPHIIAAIIPGKQDQANRAEFARQTLLTIPGFKNLQISSGEPMRIGGQSGFEMRATAVNAKSEKPVVIVQWLRFGTGGHLQIVAVAPKDDWDAAFPRFRAVRDGIEPR